MNFKKFTVTIVAALLAIPTFPYPVVVFNHGSTGRGDQAI
jgi:hypothetical protein